MYGIIILVISCLSTLLLGVSNNLCYRSICKNRRNNRCEIKLNSKELSFFVSKKGCDDMLNIIKEKLDLSPDLKKKIDWAKNYTSTSITLEKGHLIILEPSNLAYVDPHKVKINNYTFLFFNGVDTFYVNTLNDKHNLSELEKYFKLAKCS